MNDTFDVRQCNEHKARLADAIHYYEVKKDNQNTGIWLIFNMPYWSNIALSHRSIKRDHFFFTRKMTKDEKTAIASHVRLYSLHYKFNQLDDLIKDEQDNGTNMARFKHAMCSL